MPWSRIQHYFYLFSKAFSKNSLLLFYIFLQSKCPERSGWQAKGSTPVRANQPPPFLNSQFFFEYRKGRYRNIRQLQHRLTAIKLDELPLNGTLSFQSDRRTKLYIESDNHRSAASCSSNRKMIKLL